MRTEIAVRSLTDFTGATYLGANLDIHPYGVRSTQWSDFTQPRTDAPVRFRRVAVRKRDAWGTGWDHYSKSETFRYGY